MGLIEGIEGTVFYLKLKPCKTKVSESLEKEILFLALCNINYTLLSGFSSVLFLVNFLFTWLRVKPEVLGLLSHQIHCTIILLWGIHVARNDIVIVIIIIYWWDFHGKVHVISIRLFHSSRLLTNWWTREPGRPCLLTIWKMS